MTGKAKTKVSARVARAKDKRGGKIAARVEEIAASKAKRKGSRGGGLSRKDLEALRDGRA